MSIVCHQAPKYIHTNMYKPVLTLLRSTWCILIWVWQYVIVTYVLYRNKKYIWHCVLSVMLSCTSGWLAFETRPWHTAWLFNCDILGWNNIDLALSATCHDTVVAINYIRRVCWHYVAFTVLLYACALNNNLRQQCFDQAYRTTCRYSLSHTPSAEKISPPFKWLSTRLRTFYNRTRIVYITWQMAVYGRKGLDMSAKYNI